VDDPLHEEEFSHPPRCADWQHCKIIQEVHQVSFWHPPLCANGLACGEEKTGGLLLFVALFRSPAVADCRLRHVRLPCRTGAYCLEAHNQQHWDAFVHPFNRPCLLGLVRPFAISTWVHLLRDARIWMNSIAQSSLTSAPKACRFAKWFA
jgi:hypothetical protein